MKLNGTMKMAGAVLTLGAVVSLSFAAWFTIIDAIAGESEKLGGRIDTMQLQQKAEDVDFAIYQVTHKMDVVEARIDNGKGYPSDPTTLKALRRQLDILLRRQAQVLTRIEEAIR